MASNSSAAAAPVHHLPPLGRHATASAAKPTPPPSPLLLPVTVARSPSLGPSMAQRNLSHGPTGVRSISACTSPALRPFGSPLRQSQQQLQHRPQLQRLHRTPPRPQIGSTLHSRTSSGRSTPSPHLLSRCLPRPRSLTFDDASGLRSGEWGLDQDTAAAERCTDATNGAPAAAGAAPIGHSRHTSLSSSSFSASPSVGPAAMVAAGRSPAITVCFSRSDDEEEEEKEEGEEHTGYSSESGFDEADGRILYGYDDDDDDDDGDEIELDGPASKSEVPSRLHARRASFGSISRVPATPAGGLPALDLQCLFQQHSPSLPPLAGQQATKQLGPGHRRLNRGMVTRETSPRRHTPIALSPGQAPISTTSTSSINSPCLLSCNNLVHVASVTCPNTTASAVTNSAVVSRATSPSRRESMRGLDPLRRQLAAAGVASTNSRRSSLVPASSNASPQIGALTVAVSPPPVVLVAPIAAHDFDLDAFVPPLSLGPGLSIAPSAAPSRNHSRRNSSIEIRAAAAAEVAAAVTTGGAQQVEPAPRQRGRSLLSHSRQGSLAPLPPPEFLSMPSAAVITASAADASATEASSSSSSAVAVVPHSTVAAVPVLLDADGDAVAVPAPRRRRKRSQWNLQPPQLLEAGTSLFCGNDNNSSSSGVTQASDTSLRDQCDKTGQVAPEAADPRIDLPAPMISDAAGTLFSPRRPRRSRSRALVEELPQELSMPSSASSSSGSAAPQRSNSGNASNIDHSTILRGNSTAVSEPNPFKITSSMSEAERAAVEKRQSVHLADILQGLGMGNLSAILLDEASASQDNTAAVLAQARQVERVQSQAALAPQLLPVSHSRAASPVLAPLTLPLQAELSPPSLAALERAQQHQQQGSRSAHPSPMLQATSLRA